jgi:uncharacterized protein involved in outer membrane biogenesis
MRKVILTAAIVVGLVIIVVIGVMLYAALNLNGIIASNRARILAKASDSLDRKVDVRDIKASLGWGVSVDLSGVTVADDPRFSDKPFVTASDIYAKVALLPLLHHQVKVEQLSLRQPVVRIIRDQSGRLNVSTIRHKPAGAAGAAQAPAGRHPSAPSRAPIAPSAPGRPLGAAPLTAAGPQREKPSAAASLAGYSISSLAIQDGTITYQQPGARPIQIGSLNLDMENLSATSPVRLKLSMAALGTQKNLTLDGTVGPLISNGVMNASAIPLSLAVGVGPLDLAEVRAMPALAKAIPAKVQITNPVSATARLNGTTQALAFDLVTDLTQNRVVYAGMLDKAPGVPFKLSAAGTRQAGEGKLEVRKAALVLGDLNLEASQIQFGAGTTSARLSSNRFDLASLGKMVTPLSRYNASGKAQIHAMVKVANKKPEVDGVVTLASVTLVPPGKKALLRGLSGDIKMAGNSAVVGPMTFDLGSGHGRLEAYAQSLQPISATYSFNADVIKPAELTQNPKMAADHLDKLAVKGTLRGSASAPEVTADVTSPDGLLQNVAYRNLAVNAAYGSRRVTISSLKLGAFNGTVDGSANAALGGDRAFNAALNCNGIGLRPLLESQKSKAADTVRGQLTGQVRVSGRGATFDQIKPTLNGNGRISVANGKLKGVNVVADAMRKVNGVPGIGTLVSPTLIARHPELFKSPDTDLRSLSMTFTIQGPRITSHDILVSTVDYMVKGDGWFDLDKRIDMNADLLLSQQLSREMVNERKNVAYLTNRQGEVKIPVRITGQLPKPTVTPNVQDIAQRAATHAVEKQGSKVIEKFLGKKTHGLIPGLGSAPAPGATPAPNPLAPLQKLFH